MGRWKHVEEVRTESRPNAINIGPNWIHLESTQLRVLRLPYRPGPFPKTLSRVKAAVFTKGNTPSQLHVGNTVRSN